MLWFISHCFQSSRIILCQVKTYISLTRAVLRELQRDTTETIILGRIKALVIVLIPLITMHKNGLDTNGYH
jgi:hypothetical protein